MAVVYITAFYTVGWVIFTAFYTVGWVIFWDFSSSQVGNCQMGSCN